MKELIISPAEQRIVVLPDKEKEGLTQSGIIIPTMVEDKVPEIATIIAVGEGSRDDPMRYSVGQKVIYSQYSGLEVKMNLKGYGENQYKVMTQLDIMAIVKEV